MNLLKFFLIFFLSIYHGFSLECTFDWPINGSICTFSGVETTKFNKLFHPSSKNNTAVKIIEFKSSTIHTLTKELCDIFPQLKMLEVAKAALMCIAPNALENCKSLTYVDFRENELAAVDPGLFKENHQLTYINFENNHLKKVDGKMFEHLTQLWLLNVGNNFLTEFSVYQFPQLENLYKLFIYGNDLADLDVNALITKFPNLRYISIHNNLFDCNRLRIIIDTLSLKRKNRVWLVEWNKGYATRNIKLPKIEHVECTKDEINDQRTSNGGNFTATMNFVDDDKMEKKRADNDLHQKFFGVIIDLSLMIFLICGIVVIWYKKVVTLRAGAKDNFCGKIQSESIVLIRQH